jgi:hypothetical protein
VRDLPTQQQISTISKLVMRVMVGPFNA